MLSTINPENLQLSMADLKALMPMICVIVGSLLCIFGSVTRFIQAKWLVFGLSLATCGVGIFYALKSLYLEPHILFNGMYVADSFSAFFQIIFLLAAACTILLSFRYLDDEKLQLPEYYVLLLFSSIGMMFMVAALDLLVIFIALELMSLCVYMLVGFRRSDRKSNEASVKYFILGGAASAVMLYGVALLYGATGTTQLRPILQFVETSASGMPLLFSVGCWLVIAGFLFKVAAVPFHMWMPDVYEGAPVPITGFMTTGLKAAAFAAFVRVFVSLGYGTEANEILGSSIHDILWVCAVLTMFIGNLVALTQTNLKRLLAYSSIAHTGYLIVGMIAAPQSEQGFGPVVLYLAAYAVMNLGAFGILTILANRGDEGLTLNDLSGASKRHPWLCFAMAIFLFSMAGIPPTAGFIGKYLLFYSAVEAGEILLVVISVLCSAISVYYYLRVMVFMYMRDPIGSNPSHRTSIWAATTVATLAVLTIQVGLLPAKMVETAKRIVESL